MGFIEDLKKTGRNVGLGALAAVGFGTFLKETAKQEHRHEQPQYQQQTQQHQYRDYAAEDRAAVRSLHAIDYNRCPKDRGYSRGRGR